MGKCAETQCEWHTIEVHIKDKLIKHVRCVLRRVDIACTLANNVTGNPIVAIKKAHEISL